MLKISFSNKVNILTKGKNKKLFLMSMLWLLLAQIIIKYSEKFLDFSSKKTKNVIQNLYRMLDRN